MDRFLNQTALRERLRRFRPVYNVIFRRKRNYDNRPSSVEWLQRMEGRGVVLLCYGRSGSTVFADFLATHPKVMTFGEVLGEESYYSYFQWLSRGLLWFWPLRPTMMAQEFYRFCAQRVRRSGGQHCLFDIKVESLHLIEGNWRMPGPDFEFFHHLHQAGVPVVLLTRGDLVARYVSGQVAERRGAYHSYHSNSEAEVGNFAIDLEKLQNQVEQINATHGVIRKVFSGSDSFLELAYEDMFEPGSDPGTTRFKAAVADQMADLMGVENHFDVTPRLQKVSGKKGYAELISNWDEVEKYRRELYEA